MHSLETYKDPVTGMLDSPQSSGFTIAKKLKFLQNLEESNASISRVAKDMSMSPDTVMAHLERDGEFRRRVDAAKRWHAEKVEEVLMNCALDPKKTLDRIVFLRAYKPEKYARQEVSHAQVTINIGQSDISTEKSRIESMKTVIDVKQEKTGQ